ncbi:excinuclease ABC subunit UvrA [Streptomyces sp. Go-475]|uniref:ATP-binding cassette domain-containing protein n=1 Tax=Streptomyces sp. Go-475 TaxID=2072505 RepID=UPI000DEF7583|nr:excinuclease ABC subunit UvrA [Streptomyces sp. Go-475]AXE88382.1 UvrABC system protein A [Streptomyces sp. Go-475]
MNQTPVTATDEGIQVVGARENNLKDVSLVIPKNRITVFVGVSGSGKSSLVFDTVAVEAQRQLNATFPWNIRHDLPKFERPHVDAVTRLTTPVVVDQRPLGGNARSTVGTVTDVYTVMRVLFANHGNDGLGQTWLYSFNDPKGMCPECEGLGRARRASPELMIDRGKSIAEGAILLPGYTVGSANWQFYANYERLDADKKLADYTDEEMHTLLHGSNGTVEVTYPNGNVLSLRYEGLVDSFVRRHLKRDTGGMSKAARDKAAEFFTEGVCPTCEGARLNQKALATRIDGHNIADWSQMQVSDLIGVVATLRERLDTPLVTTIIETLEQIQAIGLGYLTLDRSTSTLSGGEGQRLKLVNHLGSELTGLTYIFDEPSVGLHPRDVSRLNDLLRALRDKGNTVLVVEHDPDVMAVADHVVEIGPRAGVHGGTIVFEGSYEELRVADTLTGQGLRRTGGIKENPRPWGRTLPIVNATANNLKNVSTEIPTGVLTAVTGVAGAGKSSLIAHAFRAQYPGAVFVDQSPIPRSSRSTPASYLKLMDPIRKLFAKASGEDASLFSFNSKGACEECEGRGLLITEVAYMDPVTTHCEVCEGRRFKESVLQHRVRGKNIADVLEMSAEEAGEFFLSGPLRAKANALVETGIGYLGLGQSLATLSGGERQRLKLADRLSGSGTVYILDEPTTGLHLSDIDNLVGLLDRIVERGNTVIVIEHDLAVISQADWVIDLGPEGGNTGGEIVFTGTPAELAQATHSHTGQHLSLYLAQ